MGLKKERIIIVRESLVDITGSTNEAKILGQFLYWTDRVRDFSKFIEEEQERINRNEEINKRIDIDVEELKAGWVYKTIDELSEELMNDISKNTIIKIIDHLIQKGFLHRRRNPRIKWDRTYQYRVDLVEVNKRLLESGWNTLHFKITLPDELDDTNYQNWEMEVTTLGVQNHKTGEAIPETTNKDYKNKNTYIVENEKTSETEQIPYQEIIEYLNEKAGKQYRYTTPKTRELIKARWNEGFTLDDFKKVIDNKTLEWKNTKWENYLRPVTLFSTKFESYLNDDPNIILRKKKEESKKEEYNIQEFFERLEIDYIIELTGNEYMAKKRFNEFAEKFGVDKDSRTLFNEFSSWCKKLRDGEKV